MTEYRMTPEAERVAKSRALLSQAELEKYCKEHDKGWCNDDCGLCAAKAQARHLLKVLDEPCRGHNGVPYEDLDVFPTPRRKCPDCMEEIKKEVGE